MIEKDKSMRLIKKTTSLFRSKFKNQNARRQWKDVTSLCVAGSLLFLAACDTVGTKQIGAVDSVDGPLGGAAADEPRATLIAQDILSSGGTAADAATALYFTLAVTYPIAGSLGGGGECITYNQETNKLENLKFPVGLAKAGGAIGVPGNIRGFSALHARHGRMSWSSVVAPAEKLANFGESISRAQHAAMNSSSSKIRFDEGLSKLYKNEDGSLKKEGTKIQQIRLSSILSNLRTNGGAFLYGGTLAKAFIDDANFAGGKLTTTDLIYYRPAWNDAATFTNGVITIGTSDGPQGALFQEVWQKLYSGKGVLQLNQDIGLAQLAEASASSFQKYANYNPFGTGGMTSFVTSDNEGNAVSCVVGLGKPFGSGKIGNISGIVMAPTLSDKEAEFPTTPVLMVNLPNKDFYYAGAATGGVAGTLSSVYTALKVFSEDQTLETAISAPRVFTMGQGLPVLYEPKVDMDTLSDIVKHHPVAVEVERLGKVNSVYCKNGKLNQCQSRADPRGFGLSMIQR
ncbi:MAG: gamma-glutamyltransferase [Sneathiella sp.]|nr:gamma-glutamyltransferase [Sneathiella sp.]